MTVNHCLSLVRAVDRPTGAARYGRMFDGLEPLGTDPALLMRAGDSGGVCDAAAVLDQLAPGGDDADGSKRYTPPTAKYQDMPSPPWVPVVMFALLGFGCLFIIVNYAGLFGDPENWRLLVGLASILGGIIAATNYR